MLTIKTWLHETLSMKDLVQLAELRRPSADLYLFARPFEAPKRRCKGEERIPAKLAAVFV
jgi:hypothetical protein